MKVFLLLFLLLEFYLSLEVGANIGFFWAVTWTLTSIMLGFMVLNSSSMSMKTNMESVMSGQLSMAHFKSATTSYLLSAVLFILPGVLSDFLALLTLVYAVFLQFMAKITVEEKNINFKNEGNNHVIDVEIIDERSGSDRSS